MKHPTIQKAIDIINSYPLSYNGQHYLTLGNGKKMFFEVFIRKYGLDGTKVQYSLQDVMRRMRPLEFLDYIIKDHEMIALGDHKYQIESKFYRLIIKEVVKYGKPKLELLSLYHYC